MIIPKEERSEACINCKYFRVVDGYTSKIDQSYKIPVTRCFAPENKVGAETFCVVTGVKNSEIEYSKSSCRSLRIEPDDCGPKGTWFEPANPIRKIISYFKIWFLDPSIY